MAGSQLEVSGTTVGANDDVDVSVCGAADRGIDVSAPFRLDSESRINVSMTEGRFVPTIAVMNARCDSVTCSENELGALGGDFTATLPAGDYILVVESDAQSAGAFTVEMTVGQN